MPLEFHLLRPAWLLALLPVAWLLWRLLRTQGGGHAWRGVVDAHLLPGLLVDSDGEVRRLPLGLLGLSWVLSILALAGPAWQKLPQPVYQAQQFRVILLDLSVSMNATDVAPSRLARARFEILDLLRRFDEGQTALIAYGPEPFIVSPLTGDVETIAAQVPSLGTELLPQVGARRTDLALHEAARLLRQAGAPAGDVVLMTDGLERPTAAAEAAGRLAGEGYRVSVLGIGTEQGVPVPSGQGRFLEDGDGAIVVSRLDRSVLQTLADAGGGRYRTAFAGDRDIEGLLADSRTRRIDDAVEQSDTEADQWREEGVWLLLLLLPIAALAFRRGWIGPLLALVIVLPPREAAALSWQDLWWRPDQQAMHRLEAGRVDEAAAMFEHKDWRAAAQYKAGDFASSLNSLEGIGGPAADYNRGNALARLGRLEEAVEAYRRALAATPDDEDARHNRDLVQRLLEQARQSPSPSEPPDAGDRDEFPQDDAQAGDEDRQQTRDGQQGEERAQGQDEGTDPQQAQDRQGDDAQAGDEGQPDPDRQAGASPSAGHADGQQGEPDGDPSEQAAEQASAGASEREDAPEVDARTEQAERHRAGDGSDQRDPERRESAQRGESGEDRDGASGNTAATDGEPVARTGQLDRAGSPDDTGGTMQRQGDAAGAGPGGSPGTASRGPDGGGPKEPGLADLVGEPSRQTASANPAYAAGADLENQQAIEQMLRRVEDDPAGLLRQRFLLQHLRRSGRLP